MKDKVDKYLGSVGLGFPVNEVELNTFNRVYSDYSFTLKEEAIDPFKILNDLKKENNRDLKINKKSSLTKSQSFFRRLVLAAKITDECHNQRRFGSVKFQKMVYLCENASSMNFSTNYSKQAAGPFDNKFMHSVKSGFLKQGWFEMKKIKEGNYYQVKFIPLDNVDAYKKYYDNYFKPVQLDIQFLIDAFRTWYTDDVELVATVFACWDEINSKGEAFTKQLVVQKVYDWHSAKKKFSVQQISKTVDWMTSNGIYPNK